MMARVLSKKKLYKCLLLFSLLLLITRLYDPLYLVLTPPQQDTQQRLSETDLVTASSGISLWMDLPNAFPWRHCLQEYNNVISILNCEQGKKEQIFSMEIYNRSLLWSDRLGGCYTPGQALHEGQLKDTVVRSENCSVDKAHWVWTIQGQLSWNKGCPRCVTSIKNNHPVGFQMCKEYSEDQNIEMGEYITWNGTNVLR